MIDVDSVEQGLEENAQHIDEMQELAEGQAVEIRRLKKELAKLKKDIQDDDTISSEGSA